MISGAGKYFKCGEKKINHPSAPMGELALCRDGGGVIQEKKQKPRRWMDKDARAWGSLSPRWTYIADPCMFRWIGGRGGRFAPVGEKHDGLPVWAYDDSGQQPFWIISLIIITSRPVEAAHQAIAPPLLICKIWRDHGASTGDVSPYNVYGDVDSGSAAPYGCQHDAQDAAGAVQEYRAL